MAVNNEPVNDILDFLFSSAGDALCLDIRRRDTRKTVSLHRRAGEYLDIDFVEPPVRRCANRCIFCFVDQLPGGLRKSLYVKDEDYRHSFLNGNYLTLSRITGREMKTIVRLGLSPLYLSVHATEPAVRRRLLGNSRAGNITVRLNELEEKDIQFHTQIVVCPGINDGEILENTIRDLLKMKRGLLSIAVVPVGLTKHRKNDLVPVSRALAQAICTKVRAISNDDLPVTGKRRLFLADEFFIRAGHTLPGRRYYEDYPQIENGVGLVSLLMEEWKKVKKSLPNTPVKEKRTIQPLSSNRKSSWLVLTSVSAYPFMRDIVAQLNEYLPNAAVSVTPVRNAFFGETVTVAGLITARDIIRTVAAHQEPVTAVVAPKIIFNHNGVTLDSYSITRIAKNIGKKVVAVHNLSEMAALITSPEKEQYDSRHGNPA